MFSRYYNKKWLSLPILAVLSLKCLAMDLELTQGINSALPIGIQHFDGAPVGQELAQVIEQDLRFSGQFKFINPYGSAESLAQWKQAGADSVLTAAVREQAYGHYSISYKLFDAASNGRLLLAKEYQFNRGELRDLAHHVADEIYQKLTGERGVFSTKIAYVLVQRQGGQERHSLEIADMDGRNPRSLLVSSEPIMSPTWSPDGRELAYVSFEKKRTQIYTVSLETGQRRLLTDFPGINGAPAWSPDGRHLAVVLSKGGSPKIYTVDLSNGEMKQLTFGSAIDTEPRYAPDGQSLLFTSGRGGSPQIYKLSLADGKISRQTFTGNYNARASYTPNQSQMVMQHRGDDRQFSIAVQDAATGQLMQLTSSGADESPSVAPNGRLIVYASQKQNQGVLALVSADGRLHSELPSRGGDVQEPAWSPFIH